MIDGLLAMNAPSAKGSPSWKYCLNRYGTAPVARQPSAYVHSCEPAIPFGSEPCGMRYVRQRNGCGVPPVIRAVSAAE